MDEIDSCRYEPGPASNNGCPVGKVKPPKFEKDKYLKIEKKTLEETLKDKKAEIKTMTVREVLNDMTTIDDLNVYFDVDKSDLKDQYERDLDAFVTKINMEANTIILILGHTDSDGDAAYNLALSNRRSERAKQYLIKKGVSADRIVIKNYGEEKPAEDNTNTENKSKNRRVEVRIMDLHN
jgi:outer membrane protein OmpA-like peptidoglycan-associated protein